MRRATKVGAALWALHCALVGAALIAQERGGIKEQRITIQALRAEKVPVVRGKPRPKPRKIVSRPAPPPVPKGIPMPRMEVPGEPISAPRLAPTTKVLELDLAAYVKMVRARNDRILSQQLEWQVAEETVSGARSLFEVELANTALHEENTQKNTVVESLQRSGLGQFNEFNERYDTGVEGLTSTGGKARFGYHLDSLNNNLQALNTGGADTFNEFRTFLGGTLSQPLLRNRGRKVTRAKITVAERDRDIAFQVYRKEMMRILAEAVAAYVELAAAQERLEMRRESVRIAQELAKNNREKVRLGLLAETEILEAEAGIAQRQSQERAAVQDVIVATAKVRNFISATPESYAEVSIEAADELNVEPVNTALPISLKTATRLSPEYRAALARAEREGIKLEFAKNQRLPQLDMKGSYLFNGLDTTAEKSLADAIDAGNRQWNVFMEMRVPLDGGLRSKAELKAAEHRKKQSLLEIKSTAVELTNAVDTAIQDVKNAQAQADGYQRAVEKGQELLKVELSRLDSGLSTSRIVLQREEDLNRIREERLRSLIAYKRAILVLELTRGSLLERFGMDMKIEDPTFTPVKRPTRPARASRG